jgi:hypothetical protein
MRKERQLRRTKTALAFGGILAAVTALGAWSNLQQGPASPAAASAAQAPAASGASTNVCGSWSQQGTAAATKIVSNRTIRDCAEVGTDWVITTVGGPAGSANLGVLRCGSNAACIAGRTDPSRFARWQWYQPGGIAGGVTLLGVSGSTLMIDAGGHELNFDLSGSMSDRTFAAAKGA